MMRTNRTVAARCRDAIVTAAVAAMMVLCTGRGSAWAADQRAPTPSAAPATAAGTSEGPASGAAVAEGPIAASLADSYAAREANAQDLQNFRGGDIVIVGTTGLIVVLLVIIILLSL